MKLRVGLVGLGEHWKNMHRPALRMMCDRYDVRAIYCGVSKLAENAVAEFQADPIEGYQAMMARDDIDAVLVLEDSWVGHLPAKAACQHGKAIYWAAGLSFDPTRDADFRACVEQSGIAFMAGLPRRFAPATLRLKELIATELGSPELIFCHERLNLADGNQRNEKQNRSGTSPSCPQAMQTELIQLIDWCNYVVGGRPESVMSANQDATSSDNYRALSVRYHVGGDLPQTKLPKSSSRQWESPNGHAPVKSSPTESRSVTAQISCGCYIPSRWQEAIGFRPPAAMQVRCQRGVAFIDLPGTLVWFDDAGRHHESLDGETPVGEKMLGQFHRAVTSLVRNLSGLDDAFNAAEVLQAADISNGEGRRVTLA